MLAERCGFFEHPDVQLRAVRFGEFGELDGARESRRSRAHDEDIELHTVAGSCGAVGEDQFVERKRWLILGGNDLSHGACGSLR